MVCTSIQVILFFFQVVWVLFWNVNSIWVLLCKLTIYLFTCCSVRRPLQECIHTGPIFFNLFWFWRSKITRLHWLKPILLLTVKISCEIFYLTKHAYKCNNIFCSNKVSIAMTSNLFWILLSFFGLFYS